MRACRLVALAALLAAGCLAAPPDPTDDEGGSEGDGDGAGGDDGDMQPDEDLPPVDDCAPGASLDLAWVSEVVFDQVPGNQVNLRGVALLINPGPDPIAISELSAFRSEEEGIVGEFTVTGGDIVMAPGEASGALSVEGSGVVMSEVDEEWTNFVAPAVDVQLTFGAEPVDAYVPMHLQMGRFEFDLEIRVRHQAGAPVNFGWARDAERRSATCD